MGKSLDAMARSMGSWRDDPIVRAKDQVVQGCGILIAEHVQRPVVNGRPSKIICPFDLRNRRVYRP
jgi:hypothetical protein